MRSVPLLLLVALSAADVVPAQEPTIPAGAWLDTVAGGLAHPWGLGFAPDGRIFVTERPGRILVIEGGALRPAPWATFEVPEGGPGLLGLAVAPDFERSRAVYVVASVPGPSDSTFFNQLIQLTDSAGVGVGARVLLDSLPSARAHAGSAVAFGPDDMLYVSLGDAFRPASAQDLASEGGKILRLRPDGSVPPDNPFPGSPVFALGLRNPQGFAWELESGALFATEHGPSDWPWEGGRRDHDEVNVIRAAGNYGWPEAIGAAGDRRFLDPIVVWTPAVAPSGLAFYTGPYAPWRNALLVATLRGRGLRLLRLERTGADWRVVSDDVVLAGDVLGRLRGVFVAPDGELYLTTDRRLDEGDRPDDRVYRLVLPGG